MLGLGRNDPRLVARLRVARGVQWLLRSMVAVLDAAMGAEEGPPSLPAGSACAGRSPRDGAYSGEDAIRLAEAVAARAACGNDREGMA